MSNEISIKELMECVELNSDQLDEFELYKTYINIKTGEIVTVAEKFLKMINHGEDVEKVEAIEDWQIGDYEIAEDIIENHEKYIHIINYEDINEDINEDDIMKEFCLSYKDENINADLSDVIKENGNLREFKKIIYDKGIYDEWYQYRDNKFAEKIIQW
ncbi:MAG: hypothetical protein ACERKV_08175, partial [Clostridiaceae bacterium]